MKEETKTKSGSIVVELVRATNDGHTPITLQHLLPLVQKRIDIKKPALSKYLSRLKHWEEAPWVTGNGWLTRLVKNRTLMDSTAIKALLLARHLCQKDGSFHVGSWIRRCKKLNLTEDRCRAFLRGYKRTQYLDSTTGDYAKLNLKLIGEDSFYLEQAKDADLVIGASRQR